MPLDILDLRNLILDQRVNYQQTIMNTISDSRYIIFLNGEK